MLNTVYIIIIPTYSEGSPTEDAQWFYKWLEDSANDFRVSKKLLQDVRYAVFGLGNSLYEEHFNIVARNIDLWLEKLGAAKFAPLGLGDENVVNSLHGSLEADFDHWCEGILHLIKNREFEKVSETTGCSKGNDCCSKKGKKKKKLIKGKGKHKIDVGDDDVTKDSDSELEDPVPDLEDLGSFVRVEKPEEVEEDMEDADEDEELGNGEVREMLTPLLREALTKQGYRLIGTHSGVKLCRWTKVIIVSIWKVFQRLMS